MSAGVGSVDELLTRWPGSPPSVVVVDRTGPVASWGDVDRVVPLASVTKPLVATAVWVGVEEGSVSLDDPVTHPNVPEPFGLRHLLAHASGLGPEVDDPIIAPESRRIYSNAGFELIDATLAAATGFDTRDYLRCGVLEPLGMTRTALDGSAAHGAVGTASDLARWAHEMMEPTIIHRDTAAMASTIAYPRLDGVLPGFGQQRPNPWGLGVEVRGHKSPHWTSPLNSPATFGHFGRSGALVWIDPVIGLGLVAVGDAPFGEWAVELWPRIGTRVIEGWGRRLG